MMSAVRASSFGLAAWKHLALGQAVLADHRTGASLKHLQVFLQMIDTTPAAGGAYSFHG